MKRLIVLLSLLTFVWSCGQYEDGPAISLASKRARLAGLWECQAVYKAEEDVSDQYPQLCEAVNYGFYKDGNGIYYYKGWQEYFTWQFSDDKEQIIIKFLNGNSITWNILRLTNSELWIYIENHPDLDFTPEIHFIKIEK